MHASVCVFGGPIQRELTLLPPAPPSCGMWIYLPRLLFVFSPLSFYGEVGSFSIFSQKGLCVSSLQEVSALKTNTESKGAQL